jgi:uncharacterized damage-inducible protein DinB
MSARSNVASHAMLIAAAVVITSGSAPSAVTAQNTHPGFLVEFDGQFSASSSKVVALAEAMPASVYSWSPGEGVASVVYVYMHIARYNYMYLHENMGKPSPVAPEEYRRWENEVTDKAEARAILDASMQYVRNIAAEMSPDQLENTTMLYGRQVGEWAVLLQLITHMNEHLGQSIAYARMNGVVPPWSM